MPPVLYIHRTLYDSSSIYIKSNLREQNAQYDSAYNTSIDLGGHCLLSSNRQTYSVVLGYYGRTTSNGHTIHET